MQDFPDISAVAKLYAAQGKRLLHPKRLGIVLEAAVRFFQILHNPAKTAGLTPQEIRLVLMGGQSAGRRSVSARAGQ